ncbi:helix-turn-helix domain-containing protein [uncultured Adlercreutzia sp.]|uniref:helix-turn-helix domain-containing protein n=1 Tax=uncultured Adlercreutzia sp. TaxID=875803 RepID=UPI00258A78F7|nr:helix-turn-helix domain-containing protein [uncultured Adlercreutzia sp.]
MERIRTARQIGQTIREKRLQQGLTQQELADASHVSRSLIVRLEKGTATALYPEKLIDVLSALGLHLVLVDAQDKNSAPPQFDCPAPDAADNAASEQRIQEALADLVLSTDLLKTRSRTIPHRN